MKNRAGSPTTLPPSGDHLRHAVRNRMSPVLAGWIAEECRAIVERRLGAVPPLARAALLPSDDKRAALADDLLAALHPASIAVLLSPAIEAECRLLADLARSADPMLREAALGALTGAGTDVAARNKVRELCAASLAPGLTLLGATTSGEAEHETNRMRSSIAPAAQEAVFLACLRQGAVEAALDALASHAGIARDKVAWAVGMRDARSLLSLAWRAGYSMRSARLLQTQLAGIPPASAIGPVENGAAIMGRGEIAWQIALLDDD